MDNTRLSMLSVGLLILFCVSLGEGAISPNSTCLIETVPRCKLFDQTSCTCTTCVWPFSEKSTCLEFISPKDEAIAYYSVRIFGALLIFLFACTCVLCVMGFIAFATIRKRKNGGKVFTVGSNTLICGAIGSIARCGMFAWQQYYITDMKNHLNFLPLPAIYHAVESSLWSLTVLMWALGYTFVVLSWARVQQSLQKHLADINTARIYWVILFVGFFGTLPGSIILILRNVNFLVNNFEYAIYLQYVWLGIFFLGMSITFFIYATRLMRILSEGQVAQYSMGKFLRKVTVILYVGTSFLLLVMISHFIWLVLDPSGSATDVILGYYIFSSIYLLEWGSVTCVFFTAHPMAYDGPSKFFRYICCCLPASYITGTSAELGTLDRDKSKLARTISAHETEPNIPPP